MYYVKLYYNTGFNSINIPDSDGLLNQMSSQTFPAVDILQNTGLESIRIRATFGNVKDADFCCVYDGGSSNTSSFYYFIDGLNMLGVDVAQLSLVPDYITSAGGAANLIYSDGLARRAHVSTDGYGDWNLEDDYLTPSEPLLLDTFLAKFDEHGSYSLVESSVNVPAMAGLTLSFNYENVDDTVTVPRTVPVPDVAQTTYTVDGHTGQNTRTGVFEITAGGVKEGIEQCRALGIESVITNTAFIPKDLVTITKTTETLDSQQTIGGKSVVVNIGGNLYTNYIGSELKWGNTTGASGGQKIDTEIVTGITGNTPTVTTNLSFEYENVNNMRVLYGGLNRVGILTNAGNRVESKPEEIRNGASVVSVKAIADPHLNGCAYYRFPTMNGNSSNEFFWQNAAKGLQWKQIPLMYTTKSGSALDRLSFENSRNIADYEYEGGLTGLSEKGINKVGEIFGLSKEEALGGLSGGAALGALATGHVGIAAGTLVAGYNLNRSIKKYHMQRQQELQQYAVGQSAASPDIQFSYDGEAYRDFYGESVVVYRYRPTSTDISRLDKILTMYGYRVNIPVSTGLFTGRQYFNYVEASVTVIGNSNGRLPRWWNEGIAAQMGAGVRVWHVAPDTSCYNNNPIV